MTAQSIHADPAPPPSLSPAPTPIPAPTPASPRTVIVVDRDLPKGLAANAAAVLALTLGARVPGLTGEDFADGDGAMHAGLIPTGLPVLGAPTAALAALRGAAVARGLQVVDLPAAGQQTNDYAQFRDVVGGAAAEELVYVAVLVSGDKREVRSLTGQFALLR